MKPRVFVSSTYYDLKHVRERIERFIDNYYLEPVLFESNNVIFEPYKPLDLSCYNEVKLCHMMILIIGGRYGSAISGENIQEKKDIYNKEFTSITRKEFETALKMHIPVFVFIEKNVYAEYHTYNKNKTFFETQNNGTFSFAHVDDENIFKFINFVENTAIKTFDNVDDIELYLRNQLSGMLYLYLQQLKDNKEEEKILDSVSELKNITKRMNEMLIAVGKNVITDRSFDDVINDQNKLIISFFVDQLITSLNFMNEYDVQDSELDEITNIFIEYLLDRNKLTEIFSGKISEKRWVELKKLDDLFRAKLLEYDERLTIESFDRYKITSNFYHKILPILNSNENLWNHLRELLKKSLDDKLTDLPF